MRVNPKVVIFLTCFLCANGFVIYFINQERYIYFWDAANYWDKYKIMSSLFKNAPLEALKILFQSIRSDDYNFLAVFFLIPFDFLFGSSRLAYILSITNIYALPAALSFAFLSTKIISAPTGRSTALYI